jgi:N6-adenosine-specific RNA methylase IME4
MTEPFHTIVADPPWAYPGPGGHLRSSATHRPNSHDKGLAGMGATSVGRYGSMSMPELKAMDVAAIAAPDAHLYLWTTNAFMREAHDLCEAWGFRPITVLTWGKVKSDGSPSMKIGHYYRGATEHVVFGVRGSQKLHTSKAFPTLMLWPRTSGHSVKPDQFFEMVEEASPGPYAELFARRERLGWSRWGNQVDGDFEIPELDGAA